MSSTSCTRGLAKKASQLSRPLTTERLVVVVLLLLLIMVVVRARLSWSLRLCFAAAVEAAVDASEEELLEEEVEEEDEGGVGV